MTDTFLDELIFTHSRALFQLTRGSHLAARNDFSTVLSKVQGFLRGDQSSSRVEESNLFETHHLRESSGNSTVRFSHDPYHNDHEEETHHHIQNLACSFVETPTMAPSFLLENYSGMAHDSNLQIFPFPLELPEMVSMDQFTFIALFNLALSSLLAIEESSSSSTSMELSPSPPTAAGTSNTTSTRRQQQLAKSLELWELVHWIDCNSVSLMLNTSQKLAILANMGYLYKVVGNQIASTSCYLSVLAIITTNTSSATTTLIPASTGDDAEDSRGQTTTSALVEDIPFKAFFNYVAMQGLGGAAAA